MLSWHGGSSRRQSTSCSSAATDYKLRRRRGGATAHAIKAISQQRGWPHSSYPVLGDNAVRLARETGNANIRTLFGVASSLHQNFYENWKGADHVAGDIGDVKSCYRS